ncbi:hypothetical protein Bca52824_065525 [Brassica carinata]|uniref:Uncharacterized protein n=1 Tax=Brassica carinata TaxID=52824 RepID=A0A8X7QM68_BRACI|nr:hypothetical protein Bca52824_065525 [Brassica carinata]
MFLASLDEEYMIPIQLLDDIMAKRDEQHVSGELSRAEEAGTEEATSMSTDDTTSTSTDNTTSTSIDITTSTSIDVTTSIDDVDREVTMEDSLELEEWLEDMDQNSKKKLDDDPHTSRGDLETSKASIGQHQPDEIDRQPPHIIDLHPPDIDRHGQLIIDRHHPPNIDRCPLLDVLPCCIIEMEPIEERMYMSKASHLAVPKHQRPPFWTEEAVGFHKRVKRIHDPMKIGFHALCLKLNLLFHLIEVCSTALTLGYLMILYMQKLLREGCDLEMKSIRAQQKHHRSTLTGYHRTTSTSRHRSTLPLLHRHWTRIRAEGVRCVWKSYGWRYHHAIRQVWGKEEEEMEEGKKDHE